MWGQSGTYRIQNAVALKSVEKLFMLLHNWFWTLCSLVHALSIQMLVNSYFIQKAVPDLNKWVANYFDEDVESLHHVYDVLQDSCV